MSLEKRRSDTKELKIEGSKEDFKALADVVESASKRIGLDLSPDVPRAGKIYIRGRSNDIPQFIYPRLKKGLDEFVVGLRQDGDFVVDFGYPAFNDYTTTDIVLKSPTLRMMNQVAFANLYGMERLIQEDNIIDEFTRMIDMTKFRFSRTFLQEAKAQWVHAESLKLDLDRDVFVHPDFGDVGRIPTGTTRPINQAYFVVLKVDRAMDLRTELRTYAGLWDSWINSRPNPAAMRLYSGQPPRDVGSFLERFAVYTTARIFDLDNAFLAPWSTSEPMARPAGYNWANRIYEEGPFEIKKENFTFFGFVVMGHGPDRKVYLGEPKSGEPGEDINLPGLA